MIETTERVCAACAAANPESRRFCRQCGAMLAPPPPAAPPKSVRATRRLPAVISAIAGLVVALVGAGVLSRGGSKAPAPSVSRNIVPTTLTASTAPPRAPARIDPTTITASASSVLAPEPGVTYGVGNTLDGNRDTAWNDGAPGSGAGEMLTYRFASPVQLTGIRLVNGFAASPELFQQNARIRAVVVLTDAGRFPFTLTDVADAQELTADFGRTSSVVLDVVTAYPGIVYEDLALTDIEFFAR